MKNSWGLKSQKKKTKEFKIKKYNKKWMLKLQ